MTLRDHLGPRTDENAALHDELDRLEAAYGPDIPETGNPIMDALTTHWGERCSDYEPGCPCCDAWAEYDRLLAARAVALEEAECAARKFNGNGTPTAFWPHEIANAIHALATTSSTAALDRVIRAHVEKALEMAAAECIDTAEEADLMADKHGRQISERTLQAIKRITADDVLREMGGRG